ncbi:2-isopropylmalate synthase [Candidatus Poribacteria bacterium]|nr:2-isopropylmalate synthase [Candidatus Poribacteria bacterium]
MPSAGIPDANRVHIFDTTLRDGEQSPGAALSIDEKFEIAKLLARLNVDIIEAGFPISSPADFEAVSRIAAEVHGVEVCGLARVVERDIVACWEAVKHAEKPRIHTFVGTSEIHLRGQLRKGREEVLEMAVRAVRLARSLCETVEFSPMDATRTDPVYLHEVVAATIEAGASIINIPDTVGYAVPTQFGELIRRVVEEVAAPRNARISVHCHDDLGMATSNALAAVANGARQIECTVNGVGERAGNTSLEECVMALATRRDVFGDAHTGVNTREIVPASRLVSRLMNMPVPPNKAIVGANAFAHSSGIHQDGVLKERNTFEIMDPTDVGIQASKIVLSPRSGRRALRHRLGELGYELTDEQLDQTYERFLALADKKKEVHDADLEAIVKDQIRLVPQVYVLEHVQVISGTKLVPTATVGLRRDDQVLEEAASGDGPVDASFRAVERITNVKLELTDYAIHAVTGGKDALGEVTVRVRQDGRNYVGVGSSTDIIEASVIALLDAINKVLSRNETQS